ncbi:tail fiber domain-containing protein [Mesorhizobium sp. ZMM04-5]|uniref:Tail fiber domain-containing protein n=1 Tax=Mesorhizobium marinum TaxID=3228790 RepID=A0ABV3QWM9_9HYPH
MKKAYVKPEAIKSALLSQVVAAASVVQSKTSDIRLKRDVECVGAAPNGLPLYTFRYLWSDAVYQGVMAQDVLKVFPEAVSTMPGGYLGVRYDMLGLEMTRVH